MLLERIGVEVIGLSWEKNTSPFFTSLQMQSRFHTHCIDIRDFSATRKVIQDIDPDFTIHMAAQSLVIDSFINPVETFHINTIGTMNVLESLRTCQSIRGTLLVTTDKVYKNQEKLSGYTEGDPLGGSDPYSGSKAAAEIVADVWRNIYLNEANQKIVTARSGNVIGGGDNSSNRLLPELIKSFRNNEIALIRNPKSIRPWQHVLDPLRGYIRIIELLNEKIEISNSYNFGPGAKSKLTVQEMSDLAQKQWGGSASWTVDKDADNKIKETKSLWLDSSLSRRELGWDNLLEAPEAIEWAIEWEKSSNKYPASMSQIERFFEKVPR